MEIENKTVVDKKLFVSFQRTYIQKVSFIASFSIKAQIFLLIAAIALLILAFSMELTDMYVYLIVLILLLTFYLILLFVIAPIMGYKNQPMKNAETTYTFYDDKFTTETKTETASSSQEFAHSAVQKVCETPDALYIFIAKNQAFLVSKSGFSSERDCNEVCAKFSNILGKKYIKTK